MSDVVMGLDAPEFHRRLGDDDHVQGAKIALGKEPFSHAA